MTVDLSKAITIAVGQLAEMDPETEDYETLLCSIRGLFFIQKKGWGATVSEAKPEQPKAKAEPKSEPVVEKIGDNEIIHDEIPDGFVPITYDYETVRAKLVDAKNAGIVIQSILSEYIPEGKKAKFSEVPASKYEDLYARLEMEIANNA